MFILVVTFSGARALFVSLFFMALVTEAVLCEQIWVLGQRGADLLLLLEATGVGDLDVAALGGGFVHDLLQPGIELAVPVVGRGVTARVLFVPGVTTILRRDLIQNLRFRFLLAREGQLPPAWVSHGTNGDRRIDLRVAEHTDVRLLTMVRSPSGTNIAVNIK